VDFEKWKDSDDEDSDQEGLPPLPDDYLLPGMETFDGVRLADPVSAVLDYVAKLGRPMLTRCGLDHGYRGLD
jgi:hypothetical protein